MALTVVAVAVAGAPVAPGPAHRSPRAAVFPNRAQAELSAFVGCTPGAWQTVSAAVITPPPGYTGNPNINAISDVVGIGAC